VNQSQQQEEEEHNAIKENEFKFENDQQVETPLEENKAAFDFDYP
jgi:hypothetical protein